MLHPISKIEVLEKMNTLDAIHGKESGRKWHELRRWLDQKAAEHSAHLTLLDSAPLEASPTPENSATSQAVSNAETLSASDGSAVTTRRS